MLSEFVSSASNLVDVFLQHNGSTTFSLVDAAGSGGDYFFSLDSFFLRLVFLLSSHCLTAG